MHASSIPAARILDGGVTDEGRPWFAMEYVEGRPIDAWCDENKLGVRARLALFREVCAAVQHSHDNPESNRYEIMLLASLGAEVVTSTNTGEAVERLRTESWDLVLSDMSRDGRGDEGLRLLEWILSQVVEVPLVFYVMARETDRDRPLGSFGITNQPDELIHLVFDVLERRRS